MSAELLKPCPFCGTEATLSDAKTHAICMACTTTPWMFVEAWNRRATPATAELVEGDREVTRLDLLSLIHSQCHRVYASAIDREEIDTKYMAEIEDALKAVYAKADAASRCRAQGGNTSTVSPDPDPTGESVGEVPLPADLVADDGTGEAIEAWSKSATLQSCRTYHAHMMSKLGGEAESIDTPEFHSHLGPLMMAYRDDEDTDERQAAFIAFLDAKLAQARASSFTAGARSQLPRIRHLEHERDLALRAAGGARDRALKLLQEFVNYHTEPAGMTLEIVRDGERMGEFLKTIEAREKDMVARAQAMLAATPSATAEKAAQAEPKN